MERDSPLDFPGWVEPTPVVAAPDTGRGSLRPRTLADVERELENWECDNQLTL